MEAENPGRLFSPPPLQYRNFLSGLNFETSRPVVREREQASLLGADQNINGSKSSCEILNTRISRLPKLTLCTGEQSESESESKGKDISETVGSNIPALFQDCSVPSVSHSRGAKSELCSGEELVEESRRANLITLCLLPETPSYLNTSTPSSLSPSTMSNPSFQWNAHLQNSTTLNPFLQPPTSQYPVLHQPHQNPSLQLFPLQNHLRQVLFPHDHNPAPLLHHNPPGVNSPQVRTLRNSSLQIPSYSDSKQSTWTSNEMSETNSTEESFNQIWPYEDDSNLLQQQSRAESKGARSLSMTHDDYHDHDDARFQRRLIDLNHLEQFHGASSEAVVLTDDDDDSNRILWANAAFTKASSERKIGRMQSIGPHIDPLGIPTQLASVMFRSHSQAPTRNATLWGFLKKFIVTGYGNQI